MPPQSVRPHFGTTVRRAAFPGLTLTEALYDPGLRTEWHRHVTAAFCLVLRGEYVERYRGRALECRANTVVFRPAAVEHVDHVAARGASCFLIEPSAAWQADGALAGLAASGPATINDSRARWLLLQARDELRRPDSVSPIALDGIVLSLAAACVRSRAQPCGHAVPAWLRRTRDHLEARFFESFTLDELAADAGVHRSHLATAFRRAFGVPVGEYVRVRRVEAARRALSASRRSISEIALDVGFSDQSHLTRVFRRITGCTPSVYRGRDVA